MASDLARSLLVFFYKARSSIATPADFVLTGLPRSGTSLLSSLLSEPDDCFCFNEIFYDAALLPFFFSRMRKRLVNGQPVPAKVDDDGALTTDTMGGLVETRETTFRAKARNVVIGSNVNVPYLDNIDQVLAYRYRIVVLVRDPVYALASWNSDKARAIPEAHVTDDDMNERWRQMPFDSAAREDRQADIWEHYARIILSLGDRAKVLRYETLCASPVATMAEVCDYLDVSAPASIPELRNMNLDERFPPLDAIRRAVAERCPSRARLGYG